MPRVASVPAQVNTMPAAAAAPPPPKDEPPSSPGPDGAATVATVAKRNASSRILGKSETICRIGDGVQAVCIDQVPPGCAGC